MKALSVLGTSSNAGKTWMTTALCAWLRKQGVRVAPFKAQNMSNNAWVAYGGGEMARAQAVQAEACGLLPCVQMNPILLKPSGGDLAQLIVLGQAQAHLPGRTYFERHEQLWGVVQTTLDYWKSRCDVLVLEGAGSPVELNLMNRDLVNLRPIRYLDGKWVLVGDIDRGGIYAQLAGTWALLPAADKARSLGAIVNRFRGDLSLFPDPQDFLAPHAPGLDVLGTVPFRADLQPEEEDGLSAKDEDRGTGDVIAWLRYPCAANLTDCQPWWSDTGVRTCWTADAGVLERAKVIVLPGTKNTIADLRWLKQRQLDRVIIAAAQRGTLVIGICGGYQMLGQTMVDDSGVAGERGQEAGLGLLPLDTEFVAEKIVRQVRAECDGQRWTAYEIHMGRSHIKRSVDPLHYVRTIDGPATDDTERVRAEGMRVGSVWGTYVHGLFESPRLRAKVAAEAKFTGYTPHDVLWSEMREKIYADMASHIAASVNLEPVSRYLGL
jgi:adenosylcobyric acid synthase